MLNELIFLLRLSAKADSSCKLIQEEKGEQLVQDCEPKFNSFRTREAAVIHSIRMVCKVLGPHGDEKTGCPDAWSAFCSLNQKPSIISSFKANGFNNLLEAAAISTFHRSDIIFLKQYLPEKNRKMVSVLFDARSNQLAYYVLALACHTSSVPPFASA